MKQKISKSAVERLRPGETITDTVVRGFVARRLRSGNISYGFRHFDKATGRQPWIGLGLHGEVTADQARRKALRVAGQIKDGQQPASAAAETASRRQTYGYTVDQMLDDFLARYARRQARPLRSAREYERAFRVYVRPRLGSKPVAELKRIDTVRLLDHVEDSGAPVMADRVLAYWRKALRWHAARDETFVVPLVAGMARTNPSERARKRILDDAEIRDLWAALDALHGTTAAPRCFAVFVKFLLLSAQRLRMVSNMAWSEVDGNDDWIVPEHRHKGKGRGDFTLPLTDGLRALMGQRGRGYVFSSDGGMTSFKGFSKAKTALDAKLAEIRKAAGRKPMQPWVFHDLRRTARSAMARAQVQSDVAEAVLGHVIPGVAGVYNRYGYIAEKRDALEKLGALVERILHPDDAVIHFPRKRRKR